jgi:hypothetical protein
MLAQERETETQRRADFERKYSDEVERLKELKARG